MWTLAVRLRERSNDGTRACEGAHAQGSLTEGDEDPSDLPVQLLLPNENRLRQSDRRTQDDLTKDPVAAGSFAF